jgi:uncharacterized protein YjbI with pentapeptide repeats
MDASEGQGMTARCSVRVRGGKCGRVPYDDQGRCICHSEKPDKDVQIFSAALEEVLAGQDLDFTRFVFPEGTAFGWKQFASDSTFWCARFLGKVGFHRATFQGEAAFMDVAFDGGADFSEAEFRGEAKLYRTTFGGEASFASATFGGAADFRNAEFRSGADFAGATFREAALFGEAVFQSEANFVRTEFGSETSFTEARFLRGGIFLTRAVFKGDASFRSACFDGIAFFISTTFCRTADFSEVRFRDEAVFLGLDRDDGKGGCVFSRCADTSFQWVFWDLPERVRFQRVFLGRTLLLNTDVRQVDFTDVRWASRPGGYCAVWDELAPRNEEKECALIGKLYRQLKHNYEEQRDPITAGDFHFGEMHMRRLSNPPKNRLLRFLKRNLSFLALYRWISGYGEDYALALGWIVAVTFGFAAAFDWIPSLALQTLSTGVAVHGLGPHLVYSVLCLLFRGDTLYQPGHFWGHCASVAEGVIGIPLLAMFVLALNRRFKR